MSPFLYIVITLLLNPQCQFFDAFSSDELSKIDKTLLSLESQEQSVDVQAYTAGLLMKKASFMKTPLKKLSMFRDGKKRLETIIRNYPLNAEYRIIRLVLQEKAPNMLKYNTNIEEDLRVIKETFARHSKVVQQFLLDYAKESNVLSSSDLQ